MRDLAAGALPSLGAVGVQADVMPLVRLRRQTRDQRGLGAIERARNTRGAFRARHVDSTDRPVLVVDDVVTTGATVHAVARALEDAGHPVVGAAVVAATPPHVIARNTGE